MKTIEIKIMHLKKSIEFFEKRRVIIVEDDVTGVSRSILVSPAGTIDQKTTNIFSSFSGGLVYAALSKERQNQFQLDLMSDRSALAVNNEFQMCVSVEAREGVTTGISAADRTETLNVLGDPEPSPRKLVKPGHIFPVVAQDGGTLVRPGLAEAALDLMRYCDAVSAAAFVDILDKNGEFASKDFIKEFANQHELPIISISELVRYRLENEVLVERISEAKLPSKIAGNVIARAYIDKISGSEHIAIISGEINPEIPVPIRVQRENLIDDLFGGEKSSRQSLQKSLKYMADFGSGVFVYIARPNSLTESDQSHSEIQNFQARMLREYGIGAQILREIGVTKARLLTHTSKNLVGLKSFGIEIVSQEPIPELNNSNQKNTESQIEAG
ncbi:MAG: 3,4-dihydroxy-2-butanone-4-phosphate synthase [Bdellovibrionota bacterium]